MWINKDRGKRLASSVTVSYSDIEYFSDSFTKLTTCFFENLCSYNIEINSSSFILIPLCYKVKIVESEYDKYILTNNHEREGEAVEVHQAQSQV